MIWMSKPTNIQNLVKLFSDEKWGGDAMPARCGQVGWIDWIEGKSLTSLVGVGTWTQQISKIQCHLSLIIRLFHLMTGAVVRPNCISTNMLASTIIRSTLVLVSEKNGCKPIFLHRVVREKFKPQAVSLRGNYLHSMMINCGRKIRHAESSSSV